MKNSKITVCVLLAALTVTVAVAGMINVNAASKKYLRGDVNGDYFITVMDATLVQFKVAELATPDYNFDAGDINGDGLYVSDATSIQRYVAEFEENPYHIGEWVNEDDSTVPEPSRDDYELPFVPE